MYIYVYVSVCVYVCVSMCGTTLFSFPPLPNDHNYIFGFLYIPMATAIGSTHIGIYGYLAKLQLLTPSSLSQHPRNGSVGVLSRLSMASGHLTLFCSL